MKKIILSILAIAAFASCNKALIEQKPVDGVNSVEITIENAGAVTKAETSKAGENSAVCSVNDLTALFADKNGNIVESMAFPSGTVGGAYVFNNVPSDVAKVAAIALRGNEVPATLAAAKTLAQNYEVVDGEYNSLVVFGQDLAPVVTDGVLKATFTVAPLQARIEVNSIGTTYSFAGQPEYSAFNFKTLTLDGYLNYAADLSAYALGVTRSKVEVGSGKAWSWNIKEQAVRNMVLALDIVGNGYTVAVPERTLTITTYKVNGEAIEKFEAGNIYRFDILFGEENFDENSTSEVKVDVVMTIAKWTINTTEVEFAN